MHWLIPLFAFLALIANLAGWFAHRQWGRSLAGMVGPLVVLIGVFGMTQHFLDPNTARLIFYTGLILMVLFSLWDLFYPANRRCVEEDCKNPQ